MLKRHLAAILALPLLAAAIPAAAASAAAVAVTAVPSATSATPADTVTITGKTARSSTVTLQRRIGDRWTSLTPAVTGTSADDGTYSLVFPTNWYLTHKLRVRDADTGQTSPKFTVRVHPDYNPRGKAKHWGYLHGNGTRWNPCKPISWRANTEGGFDGDIAAFKEVFADVALATGFRFRYLGTTKKEVGDRRKLKDTNILIDWKTPKQDKYLRGRAGTASPFVNRTKRGKFEAVGGNITLNSKYLMNPNHFDNPPEEIAEMNASFAAWITRHELAHVVGLGHSGNQHQTMYYSNTETNWRFGAGDLAGLRRLGAARGCLAGSTR